MQHNFDVAIATKYGIAEAVLLNHFQFWIEKNKANGTNYFDGNYWTYNSVKAFQELFPYLSIKQVRTALKRLIDEGILQTGNYNAKTYDRTLWYSITEKGEALLNGKEVKEEKTEEKPVSREPEKKVEIFIKYQDEFNELWEQYPRKQGKTNAHKAYIKARNSGATKNNFHNFTQRDHESSYFDDLEMKLLQKG